MVFDSQPPVRRRDSFERATDLLCSRSSSLDPDVKDPWSSNLEDALIDDAPDARRISSSAEAECNPSKNVQPYNDATQDRSLSTPEQSVIDRTRGNIQVAGTEIVLTGKESATRMHGGLASRTTTILPSSQPSVVNDTITLTSGPLRKPRVTSNARVKVTICFWRGEKDKLFEDHRQGQHGWMTSDAVDGPELTAAETFMHLAASGENQNSQSSNLEDTFFSANFLLSTSVQDLKCQIRRLCHTFPERLDPHCQFYDGLAPKARRRKQAEPVLTDQLSSFLIEQSEPQIAVTRQLLLIIHQIKRAHKLAFCSRQSWTSLPPCVRTISTRTTHKLYSTLQSYPEYLLAMRHKRQIRDHITTELLPRHVGNDYPHCAEPEDSRLAVLFGSGLVSEA